MKLFIVWMFLLRVIFLLFLVSFTFLAVIERLEESLVGIILR